MPFLNTRKETLQQEVNKLNPIVSGFKRALEALPLSEEDRDVVERIYKENKEKYENSKKELRKIRKESKAKKPPREKRKKPKGINQVKLSYKKKLAEKIKKTHKISGFNRRPTTVQGGSPGLGKKS